jgi:hypothetical protein
MGSTVVRPDEGARQRLTARSGGEVEAWFDDLPDLLVALAKRWQFEFGAPIPRGSVWDLPTGVSVGSASTLDARALSRTRYARSAAGYLRDIRRLSRGSTSRLLQE